MLTVEMLNEEIRKLAEKEPTWAIIEKIATLGKAKKTLLCLDMDEDAFGEGIDMEFSGRYSRENRRRVGFNSERDTREARRQYTHHPDGDEDPEYGEGPQYRRPQMTYRHGGHSEPLTRQTAMEWVSRMQHTSDGNTGARWNVEQANRIMTERGYNHDRYEWFAMMNALWSDFGKVAQKHGVDRPEFWADLTDAWLDDTDAVPDKAAAYYKFIAKH
jgi:hypothetical protein